MSDATPEKKETPQNIYTIEAPGTLRSNSSYNVAITILQAIEPCSISVSIDGGNYNAQKMLELEPMTTKMVVFNIPELELAEYFLQVNGMAGVTFEERIKLNFADDKPLVYIQLDKQGYKRTDKLDFRVVFLDNNVKPAAITQPIKIVIKQNEEQSMAEFEDVAPVNGVFTSKWVIPDDAPFGIYLLEVQLDGASVARKSFEIIEYEEPKFKIILKTPRRVRYEKEFLNMGVDASFPDETPVKGRCTLSIRSIGGYFALDGRSNEKSIDIDGSVENIIFDIIKDLGVENSFLTEPYFRTASFEVIVTIEDEASGLKESLTDIVIITKPNCVEIGEDDRECVSCGGWSPFKLSCDVENGKPITINVLNEDPKLGEPIICDVMLSKPTPYFVYFVTSRGNILKSDLVTLEEDQLKYTLQLQTTFSLVPRAFVLVYFVQDGELFHDEIGFNVKNEFENKIDINIPASAEPGSEVELLVKSNPNSLIGIMAVDTKSVLLESKNDFCSKDIFKALHEIRSETPWLDGSGEYPGLMSGLVIFTNATWQGFVKGDADGWNQGLSDREHMILPKNKRTFNINRKRKEVQRKIQERNQIFDNWLFYDKETDDDGVFNIKEMLPENPTTWLLTAISINPDTGFTMTECPLKIKTEGNDALKAQSSIEQDLDNSARPICMIEHFDVNLYEQEEYRHTFDIQVPESAQPLTVEFTISTNLLGPTLAIVPKYAGVMYCTGMLHMTTFIPNIVVLEYLETQNQLDSELAASIKEKFDEALKRELEERHDDGSFGWFGCDEVSSPHVTATIMRAFQRVSKFIEIDDKIIVEGLNYLSSLQLESGEILKENEPYQYPFQPELGVGLTATVLLAFLERKDNYDTYKTTIERACDFIVANLDATKCRYDLALSFYALTLVHHPAAETLKERLLACASFDGSKDHKWWAYSELNPDPHYNPPVSHLEVTSYILLALLETEPVESLAPIVKWLLPYGQRLGESNFSSECMDCAVSLDAVIKFALKSNAISGTTNISYTAYGPDSEEYHGSILVEPRNALTIKTHMLPKNTHSLEFSTSDKGSFMGNLTYRYLEN